MAENSNIVIAYRKQDEFGTIADGTYQKVNFSEESFKLDLGKERSKRNTGTAEKSGLVIKTKKTEGDLMFSFQKNNFDEFLASLLRSSWIDVSGGSGGGSIIAGASSSNLEITFAKETVVDAGGTITFGSGITINILKDQIIKVSNAPDSANNGIFIIKSITGNIATVNSALVDATYESLTTISGDRLRNGNTVDYYTIERKYSDIANSFVAYIDLALAKGEFTFEPEKEVEVTLSFSGSDEQLNSASVATGDYIESVTNPEFTTGEEVEGVYFDNVLLNDCLIGKLDFEVDNATEGKLSIAVLGPCAQRLKPIDVKGNISIWFPNFTYYQKYTNNTKFKLDYIFGDSLGNKYSITFAATQFSTGNINAQDMEDNVAEEHELVMSTNNVFTIQICRM